MSQLTVGEVFKSFDIFGYTVPINIDKDHPKHKTFCGAFTSIIYVIIVGAILYEVGLELILDEIDEGVFHGHPNSPHRLLN